MSATRTDYVERLTCTEAEYWELPGLSRSRLWHAITDPEEYHAIHIAKTKTAPAPGWQLQFGTDVEAYLRDGPDEEIVIIPQEVLAKGGRKVGNRYKEWLAKTLADSFRPIEKKIYKQSEYDDKFRARRQCRANVEACPTARALIYDREPEWNVRIAWHDGQCLRKCEIDLVDWDRRVIVDIKTAAETSPDKWPKRSTDLGYHLQVASQLEAVQALTGTWDWTYLWVVIRNCHAHNVEVMEADADYQRFGASHLSVAVDRYLRMAENDEWHSLTWNRITEISPPRWG